MPNLAPALSATPSGDAPALGGVQAAYIPTPGYRFMGYPVRIEIRIRTAKNGQRRATYWSRPNMGRWMPLPLVEAELLIAQGLADQAQD